MKSLVKTLEEIKRYLENLAPLDIEAVEKQIRNNSFQVLCDIVDEEFIEILNGPDRICREIMDGRELVYEYGSYSIVPPFTKEKHNTYESAYRSAMMYCNKYGREIIKSSETIGSSVAYEYITAGDWANGYIDSKLKLLFVNISNLDDNNPVAIFAYHH